MKTECDWVSVTVVLMIVFFAFKLLVIISFFCDLLWRPKQTTPHPTPRRSNLKLLKSTYNLAVEDFLFATFFPL